MRTEPFRVMVDYDAPNAIANAIKAGGFDGQYIWLPLEEIPLSKTGQAVEEVYPVPLGDGISNDLLPAALKHYGKELGLRFGLELANPLTALRSAQPFMARWSALSRPGNHEQYHLATLFNAKARLCYLWFFGDKKRSILNIQAERPDGRWSCKVIFLAVPILTA